MSNEKGAVFEPGFCLICGLYFVFDRDKVPRVSIDGEQGPLCWDCVEMVNDRCKLVPGGRREIKLEEGTYA